MEQLAFTISCELIYECEGITFELSANSRNRWTYVSIVLVQVPSVSPAVDL